MSHLIHRHLSHHPPMVVGGEGCTLIDHTGKRYLDGSGGAAVSCLGHAHPRVNHAIRAQLDKIAFAHTGFFTSEPAENLATFLAQHAPETLDHVYFISGGSEANEAAIKLARQYFIEKGEPRRHRLIARHQSYHGNTLGALSAGGNPQRRQTFAPLLLETSHISPCYAYRHQRADETETEYGHRIADELETEILHLDPATVMAFIAEPVVGATLGAVPAVKGYFQRIREICTRYGILLILDEVMCGMARTGHFFACEAENITPDIITIAKGLGAGYQPIGAMLCTDKIYNAIKSGSGFFQHGHTFIAHPTTCAAAYAVAQILIEDNMPAQTQQKGTYLRTILEQKFASHPHIGNIRGRGLFIGLELVKDKQQKTPFPREQNIAKLIKFHAFDSGLICYPMSGTADGKSGDHILLAPPYIITPAQCDELVEKLDQSLKNTFSPTPTPT